MENASRIYTAEKVRKMIERQKRKYGWQFIFLGANIDAVETAREYGIDEDCAANYCADATGTKVLYENVSEAIVNLRCKGKMNDTWRKNIEKDYRKSRK